MHGDPRILVVGNPGPEHVGRHLREACRALGLNVELCDSELAFEGSRLWKRWSWHMRGHRPSRLGAFSRQVVQVVERWKPTHVMATGLAPIDREALRRIRALGVRCLNFSTDDPWNPGHSASWFMQAVPEYDVVFTPRSVNIDQFSALGCRAVVYLPFAYAPDTHFPEPAPVDDKQRYASDVAFIGGADRDRVMWMEPLIEAQHNVALYGGYWDRYPVTRQSAKGMADARGVRLAIGGTSIALCLVRAANRDGHSMRSFEVPAIGACMVVEDTPDHRRLFGADREAVWYVRSPREAQDAVHQLLADEPLRRRLREASHALVTAGGHRWQDRLRAMLEAAQ